MFSAMSSTGLSSRTAAALAYSGWWVTGAIFWFVERQDPFVRFHAAQALVAFGLTAVLICLFAVLAAASLSFLPVTFGFFAGAAAVTWIAGIVLWLVTMWKIVRGGDEWRLPVAAALADRISRV
jgi:uncharacterized membrane protein